MTNLDFSAQGECEICKKETMICRTNVCEPCLRELETMRNEPSLQKRRLQKLARSENGIIQDARRRMMLDTNQAPRERKVSLAAVLRTREREGRIEAALAEKFRNAKRATPEELAASLPDDTLSVELREVSAELIRWLARHPEDMHRLEPRKFEEVITEIIRDMGHEVELTKPTRDGGRDILVTMKTAFGKLLVIIECKRWAPDRPVDVDVVRSFLHVIRENDKANAGVIATTATFTSDARREAHQFEWLLKLKDWENIRDWAGHYGKWHNGLWLPDDFLEK